MKKSTPAEETQRTGVKLVQWYLENQRALPWRENTNPYQIWVSETMLQQTRVEAVIPYYHAFMSAFPTVANLAAADEADVVKLWQGLGYYSRARNLHRGAKQVVELFDGQIPRDAAAVRSLSGVGPYTTGAIMSIAFDMPVPAVDGNVLRVMARIMEIRDEIRSSGAVKAITKEVERWLLQASPRLLTQALMELGALVCTPRKPKCNICPLQHHCRAFAAGITEELPIRKKPAKRRIVHVVALWCQQDHRILLEQRRDSGLLAGMWQLPATELSEDEPNNARADTTFPDTRGSGEVRDASHVALQRTYVQARETLLQLFAARPDSSQAQAPVSDETGLQVADARVLEFRTVAELKHVFTHIEWKVTVVQPIGWDLSLIEGNDRRIWAGEEDLSRLPLPRVYDKLITSFFHNLSV